MMSLSSRPYLRIGVPLAALGGLVAGVIKFSRTMTDLASVDAPESLLAVVGQGIDAFAANAGILGTELTQFVADSNSWITFTALAATAVSATSAVRQLSAWIRGPEDAGAIVRQVSDRALASVGTRVTPVRWGTVFDGTTSKPLPFARVRLLDRDGAPQAEAVSDVQGDFGFSGVDVRDAGALLVTHGGYRDAAHTYAVVAGAIAPAGHDVIMTREPGAVGSGQQSRRWRLLSSTAFWLGVLTVPVVYFTVPGGMSGFVVALFIGSAIVRAVGSRRQF